MVRPKLKLVWTHYRETENKSATCKYCEIKYKKASLQRMKRHLLKCINFPEDGKRQLRSNLAALVRSKDGDSTLQSITNRENVRPIPELDRTESTSFQPTERNMSDGHREDLHKLLAKAIYVTGTPLAMVEHPLWINFFEKLQPLYKLPTRKTISTTILDKTFGDMHRDLKGEILSKKCLHLQLDGWSNCRNEGIINVLISKPEPVFVKSIATEENRHTSEYICDVITNVLNEYGAHKFATLIGDNASNMQKAFRLVKDNHPHLTCLNCSAHTLHLLCKNIIGINTIHACKEMATGIIKTIKRSQVLTSLLSKIVKEKNAGESLKLPCDTRWGGYCTSLKSLQNTKIALQNLAVHEKATLLPNEEKSALLDESFWKLLKQCIIILEPISDVIMNLESDKNNIHKVFMTLKNMKSKLMFTLPDVTILDENTKDELLQIVDQRIRMCLKPIHFAAYLLDPATQGGELDETQEGDAMEFINDMAISIGANVMSNLASYRAREGFFSRRFLWDDTNEVTPTAWWMGLCGSTALSKVAMRILTAPCTSAAVERSFSAHSNIHSRKRNRLTTERAEKITFIAYNWNLLHRRVKDNRESDEMEECSSPLNVNTTPPREFSPEPSTSGLQHFEFFNCDRNNSESSDGDDDKSSD